MKRAWLHSLLPGVRRRIAGGPRCALYLTFDDGPDPAVTPDVLKLLHEFGAHATFFVIGQKVLEYPSLAAQIVAGGHRLGNHSFTHRRLSTLPWREQLLEVTRTEQALRTIDGASTHPFRPPYGVASMALLGRLRIAGIHTEYWSVDSNDFRHDCAASVELLVRRDFRSGDVILMHDDHGSVVDILRSCLPAWAAAGFEHPAIT
jgi:peptidoglycan/xylan/chitin deacetylase (PgdA/CDA1 family)